MGVVQLSNLVTLQFEEFMAHVDGLTEAPSLVIWDYELLLPMPAQLLPELKANPYLQTAPLVVWTSLMEEARNAACLRKGANDLIRKEADLPTLG